MAYPLFAMLVECGHTAPRHSPTRVRRQCTSGTSWSGRGGAIMTPLPSLQAPRSPASMRWPASSCATPSAGRTPSRRRSCAPGATCHRSAIPTGSTPGCTAFSSTPASDEARKHRRHTRRGRAHPDRPIPTIRRQRRSPSPSAMRSTRGFRTALDPEQRALIVLHHYLDLSLPEVAETMRIPLGTAKSRLHRALSALRACARGRRQGLRRDRGGPIRMTARDGFTRLVDTWLAEEGAPTTPDYLDLVLDRTSTHPAAAGLAQPREVAARGYDRSTRAPTRIPPVARYGRASPRSSSPSPSAARRAVRRIPAPPRAAAVRARGQRPHLLRRRRQRSWRPTRTAADARSIDVGGPASAPVPESGRHESWPSSSSIPTDVAGDKVVVADADGSSPHATSLASDRPRHRSDVQPDLVAGQHASWPSAPSARAITSCSWPALTARAFERSGTATSMGGPEPGVVALG